MREDRLTVGVLSPLLAGAYFGVILRGLARQLATDGGRVVAVQTRDTQVGRPYPWLPEPFASPLAWDVVSGFVVVTDAVPEEYLERLRERGKPVVLISSHSSRVPCPQVVPDNRGGVVQAVTHLVEHGHRRIAFVADMGRAPGDDVHERYRAYGHALRRAEIQPDPNLVFPAAGGVQEAGRQAAHAIADSGLTCTAVFAATDTLAAGLLHGFCERGVAVPEQLAVVGFDDRDFASGLSPALSTVRVDFEALGAESGRILTRMIAGSPPGASRHRLKASFVPRRSCGCAHAIEAGIHGTDLGATPAGLAPADRFARDFVTLLAGQDARETEARAAGTIAGEISQCFAEALADCTFDASTVRRAADAAFAAFPRGGTVPAVMDAAQRLRRDLLATAGYSNDRLLALDLCTLELASALYAAAGRRQVTVNSSLQRSLAEEHSVSLSLVGLGPGHCQPRSLDWLAGTHARTACLGLWDGEAEGRAAGLEIVGTYGATAAAEALSGSHLPAASFPPVPELTATRCGPEDIVMVLPVRTDNRYWGVLALTGQAESVATAGADVYFQWTGLLGMALDRDSLLEELRASEERYELAAQAANDGLWDWDVAGGSVYFSPRWKSLLGYMEHEVGSSPAEWFSRTHPDDVGALEEKVQACLRGEQSSLQIEHRLLTKDGNYRWMLCRAVAVSAGGRRSGRLVGSLTDIAERKQLEGQLRRAALYDPLTGLPNRSLFMDRLAQAFARAKRAPSYQFAVLFIDLDGFKAVNDNWGHATGDALLTRVAARLRSHLRDNDTAVRFGGDEFAVLVDGIASTQRLDAIAERLRAKLSVPYEIAGKSVAVSATIGVAVNTEGYDDPAQMIDDADAAMYRAKPASRGTNLPLTPSSPIVIGVS